MFVNITILTLDFDNPIYMPPHGLPLNWRGNQGGPLEAAVRAYINFSARPSVHPAPTAAELEWVILYLCYYVNAPGWEMPGADESAKARLANLRAKAHQMQTVTEVQAWIWDCLEVGIDPL